MVQRTKFYNINSNHELYPIFDDLCLKSKNVYNYANYLIRQEFINNGRWIRCSELYRIIKMHETYKGLPPKLSSAVLRLLDRNWVSFFKTIKDYSNYPSKYLSKPRLPRYKSRDGRNLVIFDCQQRIFKKGFIRFPKRVTNICIPTDLPNIQQLKVIPCGKYYKLEVVYNVERVEPKPFNYRVCAIDLGLENFVTMTNNIGLKPVVIKGGILKSVNQYYNKIKAKRVSILKMINKKDWSNALIKFTYKRNNRVIDLMHKYSRSIVNYCLENNISMLVVGNNKEWKQNINIGRVTNQEFVNIPFMVFIQKLRYKCQDVGINFITVEESYTSKSSFLDFDKLPSKYIEGLETNFSGRRIRRGLYRSKDGIIINADVNGSYNIMRKVIPDAFANGIAGVELHPIRLEIVL